LYFRKCLTFYPYTPDGETIATYLIMFGIGYFDLKPILKEWENTENIESLLQFSNFVFYDIEYRLLKPLKFKTAFCEPFVSEIIINWLNDTNVKKLFSIKLEKQLMNNKSLDEEYILHY